MKKLTTFLLLAFSMASFADDIAGITIYELLANSERFEGKEVDLMGFYTSGMENSVIYPNKEEASIGNYLSGIWLRGTELEKYSGQYIQLIGQFTTKDKGHLGMYRGSIEVKRVKLKTQRKI